MVEVRWTDQSLADIENIAGFIAKDSIRYSKIQVQRFIDSTKILKTQPNLGRVVPEVSDDKIRELIQGNYRIIYRVLTSNRIDILTIHHSRRLLRNIPIITD